jgi:hypothetical protein
LMTSVADALVACTSAPIAVSSGALVCTSPLDAALTSTPITWVQRPGLQTNITWNATGNALSASTVTLTVWYAYSFQWTSIASTQPAGKQFYTYSGSSLPYPCVT